jgi:hypothetical protein
MAVSSDVCSTEDAVQVFLQHLVDPFLPDKSSVRDNPSPSQHQLIAKQVCFSSFIIKYNPKIKPCDLYKYFTGLCYAVSLFS